MRARAQTPRLGVLALPALRPLSRGVFGKVLLAAALIVPNIIVALWSVDAVVGGTPAVDWVQYVEAGTRIGQPDLYGSTYSYGWHYSPILAYLFAAVGFIGTTAWRLLHFVALLALPSWKLIGLALLSWPFWYDVQTGNVVVFVFLAAAWALRGNAAGIFCFLALTLLIPRPLMLPVAAWLLWQHPSWRMPFAAMFVFHAVAVVGTGAGQAWVAEMLAAPNDLLNPTNVGPSRFIGMAWLIVGVPLAAFLTYRGRVGLASLAISPYLLPYYLIMGLLEFAPKQQGARAAFAGSAPPGPGSSLNAR